MLKVCNVFIALLIYQTALSRELTLTALQYSEKIWDMKFTSKGKTCTLSFNGKRSDLNIYECKRLEEAFAKIDNVAATKVDDKSIPIDGVLYEIENGKNKLQSLLVAPKSCSIRENGSLDCKENKLGPVQKVMLELLQFKEAKFK
jgi:hypothetical protein